VAQFPYNRPVKAKRQKKAVKLLLQHSVLVSLKRSYCYLYETASKTANACSPVLSIILISSRNKKNTIHSYSNF